MKEHYGELCLVCIQRAALVAPGCFRHNTDTAVLGEDAAKTNLLGTRDPCTQTPLASEPAAYAHLCSHRQSVQAAPDVGWGGRHGCSGEHFPRW